MPASVGGGGGTWFLLRAGSPARFTAPGPAARLRFPPHLPGSAGTPGPLPCPRSAVPSLAPLGRPDRFCGHQPGPRRTLSKENHREQCTGGGTPTRPPRSKIEVAPLQVAVRQQSQSTFSAVAFEAFGRTRPRSGFCRPSDRQSRHPRRRVARVGHLPPQGRLKSDRAATHSLGGRPVCCQPGRNACMRPSCGRPRSAPRQGEI